MPRSIISSNHGKGEEHEESGDAKFVDSEASSIASINSEKAHANHNHNAPTPEDGIDTMDMANLPYRTLTANADMGEYTHETATGLQPIKSNHTGRIERYEMVTFRENDPSNPKNWSKAFKWWITMVVALTCFCVAFNSAVITSDIIGVAETFNVSEEVALLPISLFVVGFGVGPLVFAPISEWVGRKVVYVSTLAVAVVFVIPCAVAPNIGTLLICRLIDGIAFSAPMTLVGGTSLIDMILSPL